MTYQQLASILNNEVLPNSIGDATVIAENLSNIVELGTAISDLTSDQLKDFQKRLVVGVYNWVLNREVEVGTFDLLRDAVEYGGGLQRLMSQGMLTAQDSHLLNLVNGTDYTDGHYYGVDPSAAVYTETKAFKIPYSISDDNFSQMFMNAEDTAKLVGMIEMTSRNTIRYEMYQLEKRIINRLIIAAVDNNRYIGLVTSFNNKILGIASSSDPGWKTYADILADRDLCAYFYSFVKEVVMRLRDAMMEVNTRYNDSTVQTFAPKEDIKMVGISEFFNNSKFLSAPIEFNPASWDIAIKTVTAWQTPGTDMLPDLDTCMTIKFVDPDTQYEVPCTNVVGVIYDKYGAGVTIKRQKATIQEVGSEGFRTIFNHVAANYYCDTRLSSVVLTLD